MSHPSYPKTSISLSTARRLTLAWSEKLEVIKILLRRTYLARTGPMNVRILIVVRPSRVRFYRSCGRKSHSKIPVKLSQSIVKTTSLCYQMFFRDIDRWKSTKRKKNQRHEQNDLKSRGHGNVRFLSLLNFSFATNSVMKLGGSEKCVSIYYIYCEV